METLLDVLKYNALERAFRTGWQEVYELADGYFNDIDNEHLALLRELSNEYQTDQSCLTSESWRHKLDETHTRVTRMVGMSRLKKFICVPFYLEEDISLYASTEEAYEAGRRAAFDELLDVWNRSSRSKPTCDEENNEAKYILEGAMSLLSAIANKTGYKIVTNAQGGNEDENVTA